MPRKISPVRPRRKDEKRYERRMRDNYLNPIFSRLRQRLATAEAANQAWAIMDQTVESYVAQPRAGIPIEMIQKSLNEMEGHNRKRVIQTFRSALAINIAPILADAGINAFMLQRLTENVNLIETIPQRLLTDLQSTMTELLQERPFDEDVLMQTLRSSYKSTGYNLRRITRDQTSKMTGQLNQIRQQQLGIQGYQWMTSQDGRVRSNHQALNMNYYRWDQPPSGGGTTASESGNPGSGILCRCVARAAITQADRERLRQMTA